MENQEKLDNYIELYNNILKLDTDKRRIGSELIDDFVVKLKRDVAWLAEQNERLRGIDISYKKILFIILQFNIDDKKYRIEKMIDLDNHYKETYGWVTFITTGRDYTGEPYNDVIKCQSNLTYEQLIAVLQDQRKLCESKEQE